MGDLGGSEEASVIWWPPRTSTMKWSQLEPGRQATWVAKVRAREVPKPFGEAWRIVSESQLSTELFASLKFSFALSRLQLPAAFSLLNWNRYFFYFLIMQESTIDGLWPGSSQGPQKRVTSHILHGLIEPIRLPYFPSGPIGDKHLSWRTSCPCTFPPTHDQAHLVQLGHTNLFGDTNINIKASSILGSCNHSGFSMPTPVPK